MTSGADPYVMRPFEAPVRADVTPPGSKSVTNRALVCAALAAGTSELTGVLLADDTEAMLSCLRGLGVRLTVDRGRSRITVVGCDGRLADAPAELDARLSGTTSRFVLPLLGLGGGPVRLDAGQPMRARPMGDAIAALRALGASVREEADAGHLPVTVAGGPVSGGSLDVGAAATSQVLSGLLLAAPAYREGLRLRIPGPMVSRPYVDMTMAVMRAFGAGVEETRAGECAEFVVAPGGYRATDYAVEPDASAASYLFAAAVLTGGSVRVGGLGTGALQGDVRFADVLGLMGAEVRRTEDALEVRGGGRLRGITVDMADISDTAQTLAAVAPFADGPTEVTGIGFIRRKETDRIAAVVTELRRCGVDAEETADGFVVQPGQPRPAVVQTYDDHRMAMSFALIGLRVPGIEIADPGCVAKTFPDYFSVVESLRRGR